ncbi:hypothetical protein ACQW02_24045 [Humitalea sp. 24SJ18S-53]|uniref:hypothetical protein n=1 Tax=Humitalea sp. 24SJ18S-53 TaxID=3422307 RepID=UPI003D6758BC
MTLSFARHAGAARQGLGAVAAPRHFAPRPDRPAVRCFALREWAGGLVHALRG